MSSARMIRMLGRPEAAETRHKRPDIRQERKARERIMVKLGHGSCSVGLLVTARSMEDGDTKARVFTDPPTLPGCGVGRGGEPGFGSGAELGGDFRIFGGEVGFLVGIFLEVVEVGFGGVPVVEANVLGGVEAVVADAEFPAGSDDPAVLEGGGGVAERVVVAAVGGAEDGCAPGPGGGIEEVDAGGALGALMPQAAMVVGKRSIVMGLRPLRPISRPASPWRPPGER
jgi:hypothetical protein